MFLSKFSVMLGHPKPRRCLGGAQRGLVGSCKVLAMPLDTYAGFSINTKNVLLDTLNQCAVIPHVPPCVRSLCLSLCPLVADESPQDMGGIRQFNYPSLQNTIS